MYLEIRDQIFDEVILPLVDLSAVVKVPNLEK
jgi:hypothetical protein